MSSITVVNFSEHIPQGLVGAGELLELLKVAVAAAALRRVTLGGGVTAAVAGAVLAFPVALCRVTLLLAGAADCLLVAARRLRDVVVALLAAEERVAR